MLESKGNSMVQAIIGSVVSSSGQMGRHVDQGVEHISFEKTTNIAKRRLPKPGLRLEVQDSELESSDEEDTISGDAEPESKWPADSLGLDVDAQRGLQETSDDSSSGYRWFRHSGSCPGPRMAFRY